MYFGKMNFDKIPDIGFAMAHYNRSYKTTYRSKKMSVEIAYINSGDVKLKLYNEEMYAPEGSVIVLFRHLPISTQTVGEQQVHSHYTVLGEFENYEFELLTEDDCAERGDLIIPFVTPPSPVTEHIARKLCQIASDMETDREKNSLSCAVSFLSILCELSSNRYSLNNQKSATYSRIASSVCDYVCDNLDSPITMKDLSRYTGKSANYTGYAFRKEKNMTVAQYVNMKKIKKVAQLMQNEKMSFKSACESVALTDETYGYRLFKRYMGLTPGEYMKIKKIQREQQ